MPRKLELEALEAELASIKIILAEAKRMNDAVGMIQYKQRKKELELEISAIKDAKANFASLALFFGGKPVVGSRGIAADFAGKALKGFQEIISKKYAKTELGLLGERGKIPLKDYTSLMVTGVTHGSFGFLLDELDDQTVMFDTALKETVIETIDIINSAAALDDNVFESAAENIDPRTLIALKDFFFDLDSNAATLRLVDDMHDFSLDEEAVHRARIRTENTKINEEDKEKEGILIGFLPIHRRFEIRLADGEIISGSVTKEAVEQYSSKYMEKKCIAKVKERTVTPLNRPSRIVYRLLEFVTLGLKQNDK